MTSLIVLLPSSHIEKHAGHTQFRETHRVDVDLQEALQRGVVSHHDLGDVHLEIRISKIIIRSIGLT
jgi:hypothetical protein